MFKDISALLPTNFNIKRASKYKFYDPGGVVQNYG
jgi:hypothetical protein